MSVLTGYDVCRSCFQIMKEFSCLISLLATTSADGTAKIWRTSDFVCQYELKHDRLQNWVWDCAFTSDSLFLVTGLFFSYVEFF
jgi:WD40 repeat protein